MYKNRFTLFVILITLLITACKKNLAEINRNPNAVEDPQPDYLLTAAEKTAADNYWGADNNFNSSLLIIQHWAKIQYTEPDRYIFSNSSFTSLWNAGYAQVITNLNTIIGFPDEKANTNYKAVATILRSWTFQLLTDAYGAIPYKESGKIKETLTPVYDSQKEVYFGLLDELKTAAAALNPAAGTISGDVLYGGSLDNWKKFAGALRLRIALRIADREPGKAKEVITELTADPSLLISSNSESAQLKYDKPPLQNPMAAWFSTRDDYRVGKTIIDKLYALNDPRLDIYADKPSDTSVKKYVGVPSGLTNSDANNLGFAKTSKPDSVFFRSDANPAVIISYAEVLFAKAEAAARGLLAGTAADLYKQAITASFNQYQITDTAAINAYFGQPAVAYNPANYKKSIGEQKWIALYGQGLEAFAEWRRLDYPQLAPGASGVLDGKIPVRFIYPGTEQSLNGANYKAAVAAQGTDDLLTRLWFDVK
ncbi:SusD/RagB family nutrient-binding outer membrane lipoprotein [Niabella beijingensis]|uniref:SusD/RagB family nutrient-binding outer membrane lipoprotein n=1 Tax=Niabella beijingensis TaxID=2872700 RepID=UPI001CBF2E38|nr:SusD/RagB family nutrient-binding outer membrane lipoprotein [Niabella beijingensis]MBZ4189181.1 SusD/RagB family nutrient-binding outer membrane lipoprotein [Niabella beijingensis]